MNRTSEARKRRPESRTFKAGLLAFGNLLTSLVALISFGILARIFDRHDYATYRQTLLAYNSIAPLLMAGLPQALFYFLPTGAARVRTILVENLGLLAGIGALFGLFLVLGGNELLARWFDNPDLSRTLLCLTPYALLALPITALSSCLAARDRIRQVVWYNISSRIAILICVVAPALIWRDPLAAIAGTVIGAALILLPGLALMLGSCREGSWRPTAAGMAEQLRYSLPLGAAGIVGALNINLDKILVSGFFEPERYSVYVNGAFQVPLFAVITNSATAVILPEMTAHYREGRHREAIGMWRRATVKCALVVLPIAVFLFAMGPEFIRIVFSREYTESAVVFRLYVLLLPLRIVGLNAAFQAAGRSGLVLLRVLIAIVLNVALGLILLHVEAIGYLGPAIATVAVLYLFGLPFAIVHIGRIMHERPLRVLPLRTVAAIAALSVLAAAVVALKLWIGELGDLISFTVVGLLYAAAVGGLFHVFGFVNLPSLLRSVLERFRAGS